MGAQLAIEHPVDADLVIGVPDSATAAAVGYSEESGITFTEAVNHFEAQAAQDAAVETSGALKTIAVSLSKIANDIRWMGSGPRAGIGELILPDVQPGSSIMPGKVNPVICESMIQVCAQIIGNDTAITIGGQGGVFELNLMLPLIAHNLTQSIEILTTGSQMFTNKLLKDLPLLRQSRLSVMPIDTKSWKIILKMSKIN